ncbi:MAG: class I SAM-dependent methyltransferase [Methanohalobium sp.]|uniref:class I SAM-dependent methyltransferase n=1 Tax=Methanohalobium sp. TaxID=2837493 RepID=UPI00397AEF81
MEAIKLFKKEHKNRILELGGGQGRDTINFAQNGFKVDVIDYTKKGIDTIQEKAKFQGLSGCINSIQHDVRKPLPFEDETFDGCYSHMLYCMALTTSEIEFITNELWRVLKPGGLYIYTVRNKNDADYGNGIHMGEDLYEIRKGFIVHFFDRNKIQHLSRGFEIIDIDEFEEGILPKKLYRVILRKK